MSNDITEEFQVDLARVSETPTFQLTNIAYDLTINDIPFVMSVNNQNPYGRETAPYKKDQFDNSMEPGEQTLTNWWIRSQTSFHNGAGIRYYEPAQDFPHISHRFWDSRGVDVWTEGEASLLKDVYHAYGPAAGTLIGALGSHDSRDCLVAGDEDGILHRISIDTLDPDDTFVNSTYTLDSGHNSGGATNSFIAVASDGTHYYAMCNSAIHRGNISGTTSDEVIYRHTGASYGEGIIQYAKGYLLASQDNIIYSLDDYSTKAGVNHNTGTATLSSLTNKLTHLNSAWRWNSIVGGRTHVYASGYSGNHSEIWAIPFDTTGATVDIDLPSAVSVAEMPLGEKINVIDFYLSFILIGTNKGVRVATVADDGSLSYGPLLFNSNYPVNGFTFNGNYAWAATATPNSVDSHACLIRIDLSVQFEDGTFAYAYDLEYESDEVSEARDAFFLDGRLMLVVEEGGDGEIQAEYVDRRRASGWLETGYIRYNTVEPKYFKYLEMVGDVGVSDNISIQTIDKDGTAHDIIGVDAATINERIELGQPTGKNEMIAIRFLFNNVNADSDTPVLKQYQVKSIPASKRQRYIQYPLMCFDVERDKFNSEFGYTNHAWDKVRAIESLEEDGSLVTITDYRIKEKYEAVIETIKFTNESSPDKANSGFGGTLIVTVRKI